jgi:phosphatidate cytidylyltransferase
MALSNTATRIIVSAVTIPLILIVCYLGGLFFLVFVLAIGLISYYEFSSLSANKNAYTNLVIGLLSTLIIILNSYYQFTDFLRLIILVVIISVLAELFRNRQSAILNLGSSLFGIFYIGLFSSTLILLREFFINYNTGGYLIISIFITIWICDSAAFFLGKSFGKHKLFPRVSPQKSWEGSVAGFIFAIISMYALKYILLDAFSDSDSIIVGVIIGSTGQIGDLVESLIKRDAGVKDSSGLIPGHGGIFDRFDSLMLSSPVIYLYLSYIR